VRGCLACSCRSFAGIASEVEKGAVRLSGLGGRRPFSMPASPVAALPSHGGSKLPQEGPATALDSSECPTERKQMKFKPPSPAQPGPATHDSEQYALPAGPPTKRQAEIQANITRRPGRPNFPVGKFPVPVGPRTRRAAEIYENISRGRSSRLPTTPQRARRRRGCSTAIQVGRERRPSAERTRGSRRSTASSSRTSSLSDDPGGEADPPARWEVPARLQKLSSFATFGDFHELTPSFTGPERLCLFEALPDGTQRTIYANLRTSLGGEWS
jgi:hypothetical protein